MKNSKRSCSMRMADGGVLLPGQRPVSPMSLKGIYNGARGGLADGFEAVARTFTPPPGYTPAVAPAPAMAPAAAAPSPQLGGVNMQAIQRREAAAGLRDGSPFLRGPGTSTSDSIPAHLSVGEAVLPADTVRAIGPENIQDAIDKTHTPVKSRGLRHFANGFPGMDVNVSDFTESDAKLFGQRPAGTVPGAQPRVPGIEVHEPFGPRTAPAGAPPSTPGLRVGYPISDPGPGNPNVNNMGPRQPAMSAGSPPAAGAPPTTPVTPATQGGAYRAGRAVATGLRAAGPAMIGGEIVHHFGDNRISNDLDPVDSSASGTLGYLKNGEIGNVGRSLRKGLVETGMDVATGLASVGDVFLPGTPLSDRLQKRFKDDLGPGLQTPASQPATVAQPATQVQPATNPTDMRLAQGTQTTPMDPAGTIQRRGNSFTNTGVFAEDAMKSTGNPNAQNIAAAQGLSDRYSGGGGGSGLRGGFPDSANLPAGYGATIPTSQAETELAARNAGVTSVLADRDISPRTRAQIRGQDQQVAMAAMRDSTDRRGQDITDNGFQRRDKVTMRGQDLDYGAAMGRNQLTAANYQREQFNADRSNALARDQFTNTVSNQQQEQGQKRTDAITKRVADMAPVDPATGKPDANWHANAMQGLNSIVAERQAALQRHLQTNPGDAQAKAELAEIARDGIGVLGEKHIRQLTLGMNLRGVADQGGMFGPGSRSGSTQPVTSLRKEAGTIFDSYRTPQGDSIPAWRLKSGGVGPFHWGGDMNPDYDILRK